MSSIGAIAVENVAKVPLEVHSLSTRLSGAMAYAISSIAIMMINKFVLTTYGLPSAMILCLSQFGFSIVCCGLAKALGYVKFPDMSVKSLKHVFPLPLLFCLNTLAGLTGTQRISIPMFTVLRRFTLLLTVAAEWFILGKRADRPVLACVLVMIGGALLAALSDLSFDIIGYSWILVNNLCTASSSVVLKQKLSTSTEFGKFGLIFYNSLLAFPGILFMYYLEPDTTHKAVEEFPSWTDPTFCFLFLCSSILGLVLNLSIMYCTHVNSALTTAVIGCLKNIVTTYAGMVFGGDYVFSVLNFVGINISLAGSIIYAYITFKG